MLKELGYWSRVFFASLLLLPHLPLTMILKLKLPIIRQSIEIKITLLGLSAWRKHIDVKCMIDGGRCR